MPGVIDRQIESLQASVSDLSSPEPGLGDLTAAPEIEDLLAMAVAVYVQIKTGVGQWQASVTDWDTTSWVPQARRFEASYRRLQSTFDGIGELLAEWESGGRRAGGGDRFREAKLDLDLLSQLSVDRMLRADDSFRQGRGRPMAEVRDELRRRLGA
jgi:hypothetical protein